MKTFFGHGKLTTILPSEGVKLDVASVAEGLEALSIQFPTLKPKPGQERHTIAVAGHPTVESITGCTDADTIHLVPTFAGGKHGLVTVLVGAVLVAAAIYAPGAGTALFSLAGHEVTIGGVLMSLGATIALNGIMELISPAPKLDLGNFSGSKNPEASKYLPASGNTTAIGERVPVLYGKGKVFGQLLSVNVDAVDVAV